MDTVNERTETSPAVLTHPHRWIMSIVGDYKFKVFCGADDNPRSRMNKGVIQA